MSTSSKNSDADLEEMELKSMDALMVAGGLTIVQTLNTVQRAKLIRDLKSTNHRRFTQRLSENGNQAFASTPQTGKRCNFAVPIHVLTANVPIISTNTDTQKHNPSRTH